MKQISKAEYNYKCWRGEEEEAIAEESCKVKLIVKVWANISSLKQEYTSVKLSEEAKEVKKK